MWGKMVFFYAPSCIGVLEGSKHIWCDDMFLESGLPIFPWNKYDKGFFSRKKTMLCTKNVHASRNHVESPGKWKVLSPNSQPASTIPKSYLNFSMADFPVESRISCLSRNSLAMCKGQTRPACTKQREKKDSAFCSQLQQSNTKIESLKIQYSVMLQKEAQSLNNQYA